MNQNRVTVFNNNHESGINPAIKIEVGDSLMGTLFERDLDMLDKARSIDRLTIMEMPLTNGKSEFYLSVHMQEGPEGYVLITQRKKSRFWLRLSTLVNFINEKCPNFRETTIRQKRPFFSLEIHTEKQQT